MMVFLVRKILNTIFISCFIQKVKGIKNLPLGGCIIASNHLSYLDPFLLMGIVENSRKRRVYYLGKKQALRNPLFFLFYQIYDVITIDLTKSGTTALKSASDRLSSHQIIGIFPEGSRSLDGKLQKGKTGVVRLALENRVPIIPLHIKGTFELWSPAMPLPKVRKTVVLTFRNQISLKRYYGKKVTKKLLRDLTDMVMRKVEKGR